MGHCLWFATIIFLHGQSQCADGSANASRATTYPAGSDSAASNLNVIAAGLEHMLVGYSTSAVWCSLKINRTVSPCAADRIKLVAGLCRLSLALHAACKTSAIGE